MTGGHIIKALAITVYASLGSRETVRIVLMITTLNDLEVKSSDIMVDYVQAPVTEKVLTTQGPEFSIDARKTIVIVRVLYGLKSAGAAFRSHLSKCMESLGYQSCKADPDL